MNEDEFKKLFHRFVEEERLDPMVAEKLLLRILKILKESKNIDDG